MEGEGWLRTSYGAKGWQKISEYRHMGGECLKFLKKRRMIFERPSTGSTHKH